MKKILLLIAIFTLTTINSFSQNKKEKEKPLIDYRIDNMGYWRKMAKQGLVPVQPNTKPEKAIIKSSRINVRGINADSPDVPVSSTGNDTQSEVSIFVNPTDNSRVLNSNNSSGWNGSNIGGTFYGTSYLSTDDYGLTWGGSVQGPGGGNSGDPSVVINLSGRQYIGFIHSNSGQGVSYSDDGVNWTSVVAGNPTGASILDKNHLWVDNSISSPFEGNLYNAWVDFNTGSEIFFVRSIDDGLTYSPPINISSNVNAGNFSHGVNISSGPNGEVYATWAIYDGGALTEDAIGFAKSTDGGATFTPAIRIHNNIKGIRATGVLKNHRVNSFPSMTVDISGGANNGNIYIVWSNIGEPGTNTGTNKSVYMLKSTDGGTIWETPVRINQGAFIDGKEAYFPWITSDPESGVLSAIFYDDRDVTSTQVETWVANSYDGGVTWEDFRISDVAFTPQPISGLASGYMGDYLGISARGGMVYPVWPDNRNGYVQTFVSPYETNTREKPTNLQIALTEATGQTDLTWDFDGVSTFLNFIVYRDGVQIGTTTNLFYTDNLPTYGLYTYSVTAMHDDGESSGVNGSIQWGNPNISVSPASLTETLPTNDTSVQVLTITNTGELELTYNIDTEITNSSSRDPEDYCDASGGGDEYISGVEFGNISNTGTGPDDYTDYSAMSTNVDAGNTYPITITIGNVYNVDDIGIWIDWNQDEDFDDENENQVCVSTIGTAGNYNYNINVPSDAVGGETIMRVRLKWSGGDCGSACDTTTYGEVEDYTINVNSWLQLGEFIGVLAPGASENVNVNFDSTGLEIGDYTAAITINSNATTTPQVEVPVTLHVVDDTVLNATVTADDTEICNSSSTILHANPNGGTGTYTYSWTSVPVGFTSSEENPSVSPLVDTIYTVSVNDGVQNITSGITVTVIDVLGQTIAPSGAEELCQDSVNETYTTLAVVGATSYNWTISPTSAGVIDGSTVSAIVNWDQNFNGDATISVSAINECGSGLSSALIVTINELPTVTLTSFDAVCFNELPFDLTGGLPINGTYTGSGVTNGNFDPIDAGVGVHTITYAYENTNGCENFATKTIEVYDIPTVTLTSFDTVNDSEPAFELTGGLPLGGTYTGNGVTGGFFDASIAGIGMHTITYTYTDATNGCINTAQQTIEVEETLGVNDIANGINFNLYPNPNNGILNLTINSLNYQNFEAKIINQIGITVVNKKINISDNTNYSFDLTNLTTGIYFFSIRNEDVNYVKRIIVENK